MTSEQLELARRIALKQLESRARTEEEIRRALSKRNTPDEVADEVIARFKEVGLIDDDAFAEALTNTRLGVQRRGAMRIRQELRDKGISEELVQERLAAIDPDDELAAAEAFAVKKMRSYRGLEPLVAKRRLYGALARRGFGPEVVRKAAESALTPHDD